jgi:hypothetical protein
MTKKVIRYEVIDNRERWMGSYSPLLNKTCNVSAFEMAKINAIQSNSKIFTVYEDETREEIWPNKKLKN